MAPDPHPHHHPAHLHAHHHPAGRAHPPATVGPSILRMSALARLGVAAGAIAVLWAAVFWAMTRIAP